MSIEVTLAAAIGVLLCLYLLFGGADFGGGVWDLLASGPRAADQRRAVAAAIGPIWEANHEDAFHRTSGEPGQHLAGVAVMNTSKCVPFKSTFSKCFTMPRGSSSVS